MADSNPFSPAYQITELDDTPDFKNSRMVMKNLEENDSNSSVFDLTEFPSYYDNGLNLSHQETRLEGQGMSNERRSTEEHESLVVTQQPNSSRRQMPVYTLHWRSTPYAQFLPMSGLDFLTGVPDVVIQQTVDNLLSPSTSSRHVIKVPNGETLYTTSENSTLLQRTLCGAQRGFTMALLDPTNQEAAKLVRRAGCPIGCFGCCLQELDIYLPESELFVGRIRQNWTMTSTSFSVVDENYNVIFLILAPADTYACFVKDEATFTIMSRDNETRLGTIIRRWDNYLGDFILHVTFPASGTLENHKVLFLAAALLIDYMFFASRHRKYRGSC